jgi:hypothetical protein
MTTKQYVKSRRELRRLINIDWVVGAAFAGGILDFRHLHNGNYLVFFACAIAQLASSWILAPKCPKSHVRLPNIETAGECRREASHTVTIGLSIVHGIHSGTPCDAELSAS